MHAIIDPAHGEDISHIVYGVNALGLPAQMADGPPGSRPFMRAQPSVPGMYISLFNETSSSLAVMGERNSRFASIIQARGASPETPEI